MKNNVWTWDDAACIAYSLKHVSQVPSKDQIALMSTCLLKKQKTNFRILKIP